MDDETHVITLGIELGALTEVPVWESHERGTNFAATLTGLNPSSPGGLDRVFWKRAKGGYFYLVPDGLQPGALVEFAGDYRTTSGRREARRTYVLVMSVSDDALIGETLTLAEAKERLRGGGQESELSEDEQRLVDALAALPLDRRSVVIKAALR